MRNPADAPALFFAPFVSSTMRAEAHWIDYNGHLNAAYYNVFFDRAVDEAFGLVGLGPGYVEERKASFFVVESHIRYRRELRENDPVRVTLQLLAFDEKRIHWAAHDIIENRPPLSRWHPDHAEAFKAFVEGKNG